MTMLSLVAVLIASEFAGQAQAAGKPSTPAPGTCPGGSTQITTPVPSRPAIVTAVRSLEFPLPNGSQVKMDLDAIFGTSVTEGSPFRPTSGLSMDDPCAHRIRVGAAVSSIDLNAFEFGVNFGFTPNGSTAIVRGINGKTSVKVGTISMEFYAEDCVRGVCSRVAGSTANHLTAGVNLQFDIDFGEIKTGPALVYNTPLAGIFRNIMLSGLRSLSRNPNVVSLPWEATVTEFVPELGSIFLNAGRNANLGPNQSLSVMIPVAGAGACPGYRKIADVYTKEVDVVSSSATVQQTYATGGAARTIRPGDLVHVRVLGN